MKRLVHRFVTSRSFTRRLSIVAVAVVAFAALELLAVQQALAGIVCCSSSSFTDCICDPSLVCSITTISKLTGKSTFYGTQVPGKTCWNLSSYGSSSQIKSTITCHDVNGSGTTTLASTSFQQNALLSCMVEDSSISSHNGTGFCQLALSYSRPAGLTTCLNNNTNPPTSTLTYAALCQDASGGNANSRLTVAGTLRCPATLPDGTQLNNDLPNWCKNVDESPNTDCILSLGVADTQGKCTTLFSPDGTVLSYSQTVEGSVCDTLSEVIALDQAQTGYCTGGTFNGAPVDCTPKTQTFNFTGSGTTGNAVQFDVAFSPTSLNLTCGPNNNDTWNFTISANQSLTDLTRIVTSSLAVEGVSNEVACDPVNTTVVPNTLTCHVKACQQESNLCDIGPVVCANRNANGTADLIVTGTLKDPATPIFGDDQNHKTTGQCQPVPPQCQL